MPWLIAPSHPDIVDAPVLVLASVTESVVTATWHLVRDGGLPAVFLLMALGSACIPIPSEVVMLFAGFAVADPGGSGAHHHLTMTGIVLAGLLGTLVGSWVGYAIGRGGRLELMERHGHLVHMGPAQIERADRWFSRYGEMTVLFGRMIPLVRAFVSLPAGVAKMPLPRFSVLTVIGSIPWVLALAHCRPRARRGLDERAQGLRVRRLRDRRARRGGRRLLDRPPPPCGPGGGRRSRRGGSRSRLVSRVGTHRRWLRDLPEPRRQRSCRCATHCCWA